MCFAVTFFKLQRYAALCYRVTHHVQPK